MFEASRLQWDYNLRSSVHDFYALSTCNIHRPSIQSMQFNETHVITRCKWRSVFEMSTCAISSLEQLEEHWTRWPGPRSVISMSSMFCNSSWIAENYGGAEELCLRNINIALPQRPWAQIQIDILYDLYASFTMTHPAMFTRQIEVYFHNQ